MKFIINIFGYILFKVFSLMEDVVKYYVVKCGICSKVDYIYVKLVFESFYLLLGVNVLEEIGIFI